MSAGDFSGPNIHAARQRLGEHGSSKLIRESVYIHFRIDRVEGRT